MHEFREAKRAVPATRHGRSRVILNSALAALILLLLDRKSVV